MKIIKQYILSSLVLLSMLFAACDDDDKMVVLQPEASGSFVDERDNVEYHWVRYGGLDWMTENLRYVPTDGNFAPDLTPPWSGYYDDGKNTLYYNTYGGLYDFETALKSVPEGWRLPTDADWQQLEKAMGMSSEDLGKIGKRGTGQGDLLRQEAGEGGIGLLLGGYLIPDEQMDVYTYESVYGFYWTATVDETKTGENYIYYRQILYNTSNVERNSMTRNNLLSVRCVRDAIGE